MIQNLEQIKILHAFCNKMCGESKIRFCGVINSMGRLITGSFKDDILPLDTDQQRQMLYMQSQLELSMKSEFDNNLGHVNYILTFRDNLVIICIPIKNQQFHVMISAERVADVKKIVENVLGEFDKNNLILNHNVHKNDDVLVRHPHHIV